MNAPQYARFDAPSGKNGYRGKNNDDALPAMPSWDTATSKKVQDDDEVVEMEKLDHDAAEPMLPKHDRSDDGDLGSMGAVGSQYGNADYRQPQYASVPAAGPHNDHQSYYAQPQSATGQQHGPAQEQQAYHQSQNYGYGHSFARQEQQIDHMRQPQDASQQQFYQQQQLQQLQQQQQQPPGMRYQSHDSNWTSNPAPSAAPPPSSSQTRDPPMHSPIQPQQYGEPNIYAPVGRKPVQGTWRDV